MAFKKLTESQIEARLLCCNMATGVYWVDRGKEEHGDYARVVSIDYSTLTITQYPRAHPQLVAVAKQQAQDIQKKRGDEYQLSAVGQTITLGHGR